MDSLEEQRKIADNNPDDWYEEPVLIDAKDLTEVAGGCFLGCSDGSCGS